MLPLPLTLAKARRLWHDDYEAHSRALPVQLRTRQHPATYDAAGRVLRLARTEQYGVHPKVAPSTAKDLMAHLIFRSVRALEQRNRALGYQVPVEGADAPADAPALSVNCPQLAAYCSLSSRTVRSHVAILLKMGAITRKVWHGTRANFELWINPKYLWATPPAAGESDLDALCIGTLLTGVATKFPVNVAFETLETKKPECTGGDKLVTPTELVPAVDAGPCRATAPGRKKRATLTGNTGLQPVLAPERTGGGVGGAASAPGVEVAPPVSVVAKPEQMALAQAFWAHARPRLYPGQAFDEAQVRQTLNAIWSGVYAGFRQGPTAAEWLLYHRQALERVDLVAGWLERHPGKSLPGPYAEIVMGRGYFDRGNARGFVQTEEWLARQQANQQARRVARVLDQAARDFRRWHARIPPAWLRALPKAQLIKRHLSRVQALRCPAALQRFHQLACSHA